MEHSPVACKTRQKVFSCFLVVSNNDIMILNLRFLNVYVNLIHF